MKTANDELNVPTRGYVACRNRPLLVGTVFVYCVIIPVRLLAVKRAELPFLREQSVGSRL